MKGGDIEVALEGCALYVVAVEDSFVFTFAHAEAAFAEPVHFVADEDRIAGHVIN